MVLRNPISFETAFATYSASKVIGEGGTSRVYLATDDTGKACAIKVLDPVKANRERIKRFKNEVLFCLRNPHPNIVEVTDHGVVEIKGAKAPFYVMPFYPSSLRAIMKVGIPRAQVLIFWAQILDGVEAAHLLGVIHRDLKPENVLHDPTTGRLIVGDFGIAFFREEDIYTSVETSPGTRLANFQYAAPEQHTRGLSVDRRADIFALGLILNEMFTGEVPQGTGYKTIQSVAPDYVYLDEIVATMLRQSPSDRLGSIEVVKQQLIARKNEFVARQRVSELSRTVIPVGEMDDPLVVDPPRLIGFDWDRGLLTLQLSRSVNAKWVQALQSMGNYSFITGKEPHLFRIDGDKARIPAREQEVQGIIDHFKSWLSIANAKYGAMARHEKEEAEARLRAQLQAEIEEQERRERILKSAKI